MADPETGYLQPSEDQLPEEIFTDQTKFLRAIHPRFLDLVYPIESGLVDELRSNSVFDSDNEGSIKGEKTRRDKARKCWSLLNKVLPHQFPSCYSALKARCGLVVGGKTFQRDDGGEGGGEGCVRHVIERKMSLRRFADVFPGADGCSHKEYRRMTEGSDMDDSLWDRAFKLCSRNKDNKVFITMMETMLRTAHIPLPEDLQALMARGFPCLCQESVPLTKAKKRKRSKKKEKSHKRVKKFHAVTDCHSDTEKVTASTLEVVVSPKDSSALTATGLGSAAEASSSAHALHREDIHMLSTQDSKEETTQSEDTHQHCCFETQEQKDTFLKRLEGLNTAITKASSIETLFQEAAGIQLELTALNQPTRSDPLETKQLEEKGKTHRLHVKIRDLQTKLEKAHKEASLTWEETEKMATATKLPDQHLKALSDRRELLASELNQADDFYHRSVEIFTQLNLDTISNQEQAEENVAESNPDVLPSIQVCFEKVDQQIAEQDADSYDGDSSPEWESCDSFNDEGSEHDFDNEEGGFDLDNEEVYEIDYCDFDGENGDGVESDSRDTDENNDDIYGGDEYINGEDAADYDNDSNTNDSSNFHDDIVNDDSNFDDEVDFYYSSDFEDYDEF